MLACMMPAAVWNVAPSVSTSVRFTPLTCMQIFLVIFFLARLTQLPQTVSPVWFWHSVTCFPSHSPLYAEQSICG